MKMLGLGSEVCRVRFYTHDWWCVQADIGM
jgi:hypothetical protein